MKCIMVRLDAYAFLDVSHDWYAMATAIFTRTAIIDMLGKMLCQKLSPDEKPEEAFAEYIFQQVGYEVDRRNEGKDEFNIDEYWTTDEVEHVVDYLISCYKLNRPYVPDGGYLKFMACVWHEDNQLSGASICLVAEHVDDDSEPCKIESDDTVREPDDGSGSNRRYLSAVFK
ncbi:hypothetical protein PHABIO_60 [Pseudomonas phage Phabio]|uniref:Uncharacterized protein n=1 Tax=Pseudomonas phage Phabio TaxID=2006668 RepID=A0A1Y0ST88_9CAUD|nr:hypothetical protein MZD05_gp060 [Pseudomonas phage Phabio]ARV76691.1 hypothetical protein PHABIO_60 [Pseudomonas phage Phabio]